MTAKQVPLKIEELTKRYGSLTAVDGVSFELQEGEVFGLLGPNGAGKTSIISTVTTVEEPSSGRVSIFGHDVVLSPKLAKARMGCVPQELVNHGFFSVEEILEFHSGYYGIWNNGERIDYLIGKLALGAHRHKRVKELSGGLKRRLLIAKALVHEPKLLLLDEPTAGVDLELRSSLWDFVSEMKRSGVSILLTTHYLEEAEVLCDRVGILDKGVLKLIGETRKIVKEFTQRVVIFSLKEPIPPVSHRHLVSQTDHTLVFKFAAYQNVGQLIAEVPLNIKGVQDITIREGKLEDAFQEILGGQGG